jgi:hypothetical protein
MRLASQRKRLAIGPQDGYGISHKAHPRLKKSEMALHHGNGLAESLERA